MASTSTTTITTTTIWLDLFLAQLMYLLFTLIRFDEAAADWEEDDDDDDEACSSAFEDRLTFLSPSKLIPLAGGAVRAESQNILNVNQLSRFVRLMSGI